MLITGAALAAGCLSAAPSAMAGNFVVGNQSAAVGATVTFWGAQWWMQNSLSGGSAPPSFKGYAELVAEPLCAAPWSTEPGNSSGPPAAPLPELIEVIVADTITKSGPVISGDAPGVVLVKTNPGYEPDPGHPGTGTVVKVLCPVEPSHEGEEEHVIT